MDILLSPRIDLLYSFQFEEDEIEDALKRLRSSIGSIINQNVNICVSNTSTVCIYDRIKDLGNIRYIHKYSGRNFCKSLIINFGVRHLIRTPYFLLSDIDLVYGEKFIETIILYAYQDFPCRVIFHNYNLGYEFYSIHQEDYDIYKTVRDPIRTYYGIAPGNGLVHTKSFYMVRGFDEAFSEYGCEDADFNNRISYINQYKEDDRQELVTIHLFHKRKTIFIEKTKTYQEKTLVYRNEQLYLNKKNLLKYQFNLDRPFDIRTDLKSIQANLTKDWGVI